MTIDEKQAYLEKVAADLGEHFDCVQILAHDSDTDSYSTFEAGSGSLMLGSIKPCGGQKNRTA